MIEVIDKEILDELRDVAKRFKNEESTLDPNVMHSASASLQLESFETEFPKTMAEFRRLDLIHKGEYDYHYSTACKEFLDLVSIGKSNKIIIKRADQQEITRLRERNHTLETKLREYELANTEKQDELITLKTKIRVACNQHSFLKAYFEDQEGILEEKQDD
jgi:hypothetical protein